jgi:hypothetical protein
MEGNAGRCTEVILSGPRRPPCETAGPRARMFVGKQGYHVPLVAGALTARRLKEIQRELTVRPVLTVEYQKPKPFAVYEMDDTYIVVPRAWQAQSPTSGIQEAY